MLLEKTKIGLFDEARIQLALYDHCMQGKYLMVPNVSWSWFSWETDLISITRAGYVHEYEIKCTHQDFKNDYKKRKHLTFRDAAARQIHENRLRRIPNYFWYVAPIRAIPLCVPGYAGLMEVTHKRYGLQLQVIRKPKMLHHNKMSHDAIRAIMRSLMYKYWNVARDRDNWKIQKDLFT
jgi:hypothetical protein